MIYFTRGHGQRTQIACCESEASAARRDAAGWRRVTPEQYMVWWRYLDAMRLGAIKREMRRPPVLAERTVGEVW